MKILESLKKWWLRSMHGVGRKVYWDNRMDKRFTGEYIQTTKKDENGHVGIYNEKVGNRVVPYYYLTSVKKH